MARGFYEFAGRKGEYTRKRGLDHDTNKELLIKHIWDNRTQGSPLRDLIEVLPALGERRVRQLLQELKRSRKIHTVGITRSARWFPGEPD